MNAEEKVETPDQLRRRLYELEKVRRGQGTARRLGPVGTWSTGGKR